MLVSAKFEYQRGLLSRLADWFFGPYTPLTLTSGRKPRAVWPGSHLLANKMYPEKSEGWNQHSPVSRGSNDSGHLLQGADSDNHQLLLPPVTFQPRVTFISANISQDSYCLKMHSMDHTGSPRYAVHLCPPAEAVCLPGEPRSVLPSWAPSATPLTSLALRNYCLFVGRKRNGMNKCLHFLLSADKH